jgi:hypothetical protein
MSLSTLATLVGAHAKTAAAVLAVSAATGGGLAVATTVANSHAAPGLAIAKAAASPSSSASADGTDPTDPTTTASAATSPTTTSTPVTCDNAKNHGAYVSSVAHATPTPSGTASPAPNAHGKAVSEAAQSSCGKPAGASSDSTSTDGAGDSSDATDATDGDSGDGAGKPTAIPSHPAHPKHSGHPGH